MSLKGGLSDTELRNAIANNNLYQYVEEGRISIEKYNQLMQLCKPTQDDGIKIDFDDKPSTKKKIIIALVIGIILIACIVCIAFAHQGRTDSNGGHRDNNNDSGLGGYHYHCGGYPAHLHPNGVCPYSSTPITYKSPSTGSTSEYNAAYGVDYDYGYEDGYDQGFEKGRTEGHHEGYDEGFKEGKEEGYQEGYDARIAEAKAERKKGLREFMVLLGAIILIVLIVKFIKKIKASKTK